MKAISALDQEQKERLLCETLAFQCNHSNLQQCPGKAYFNYSKCPFHFKPCKDIVWEDWKDAKVSTRSMK